MSYRASVRHWISQTVTGLERRVVQDVLLTKDKQPGSGELLRRVRILVVGVFRISTKQSGQLLLHHDVLLSHRSLC